MATTMRAPRQPMSGSAATQSSSVRSLSLADVATKGKPLPKRYAFHAAPGYGKTSILAFSPNPIFLLTRGETGLNTLIDAGQIPPTSHFPELQDWSDLLAAVRLLRTGAHEYKTLVLDTANGAERMMHEYVCERDFGGDWTERGFGGYQRGYDVSMNDWRLFLNDLDKLRTERNMTIFFLLHTQIKTFKNPSGADYDRYSPKMHDKTWGLTQGWLDAIFFGNYEVLVKQGAKVVDAGKKGKAAETSHRILYTGSELNPIFDAKNRMGLPEEIEMGDSPQEGWTNLTGAIRASRKMEPQTVEANEPAQEVVNA